MHADTTPWKAADTGSLPAPPRAGEVQLWLLSLDDPPWPSNKLTACLTDEEHERAARFHFPELRSRWAHARGLLRHLLAAALGARPANLRFELGEQGKPRLAVPFSRSDLDFNLSHSGGWALLGLSDGAALGVDIEVPRPVPEQFAIAESHFAPAECAALQALPPPLQPEGFLACWTRKEAFVKALGGGLAIPLHSFEVALHPHEPAALRYSADPAHPASAYTVWAARTPAGAHAAAAVRRMGATVQPFSLR